VTDGQQPERAPTTKCHARSDDWTYDQASVPSGSAPRSIDTTTANPARRYDYWLGGKDNFAADRESGDAFAAAFPGIRVAAQENRRFLRRVVSYLAGEAGIRQFVDIGVGLPAADNTHEVAQGIAPDCRVVYVDNDPMVLTHARALLTGTRDGVTVHIEADLRDPDRILRHPALHITCDFAQPVAVLLLAVLPFITDEDDPYGIVARLIDALPPGSYLAASHPTLDPLPAEVVAKLDGVEDTSRLPFRPRTRGEFARFFAGLELVPPGICSISAWRADDEPPPRPSEADTAAYGAVARVPAAPPQTSAMLGNQVSRFWAPTSPPRHERAGGRNRCWPSDMRPLQQHQYEQQIVRSCQGGGGTEEAR
jgi:S-adenosyl methyltransferase